MEQLAGGDHGHGLDVGRDVAQDGQQAVEERLQSLEDRDHESRGEIVHQTQFIRFYF